MRNSSGEYLTFNFNRTYRLIAIDFENKDQSLACSIEQAFHKSREKRTRWPTNEIRQI